ncbi:MAG: molybdopterin molybdotransferase MoeA [Deltaproteobacteria bacterium]|nr:molybdopterin molybdotransferase MoeA [Deltaproteobacteria bacterium]
MIDFAQALNIIIEHTPGPGNVEEVPLGQSCGRILAREISSDVELPPFNRSAMDGFAVRASDLAQTPVTLDVVMDVPAGGVPKGRIGPGQAASIMTGAPVPEGADTVIMVEWTSGFGDKRVVISRGAEKGLNISPSGEILKVGQTILGTGTEIGVEEAGALAAVGCDPVPVFSRPSVAVLSTGDELVPPSEVPGPSQIRDCNGPAMVGFLRDLGFDPVDLGRASDDLEATRVALEKGLEYDCLLVSGGVSAGAYDFVQDVLSNLGVNVHTSRVAVKPGKPTVFGTRENHMVFGLPGNPVSTMVIARVMVEPALRKRLGCTEFGPRMIRATLQGDIRKKPDRLWFVYGVLGLGLQVNVTPIKNRGSADIPSATQGDCLIVAPKGVDFVEKGTEVDVVVWNRCL